MLTATNTPGAAAFTENSDETVDYSPASVGWLTQNGWA